MRFSRFFSKFSKNIFSIELFPSREQTEQKNSILYIEGEKCMIFPKVQFVARGRSPRATKHRGKNEHSLQKYIYYFFHGRE
jgi:hypothetical protein